jgi:hypothetical protein
MQRSLPRRPGTEATASQNSSYSKTQRRSSTWSKSTRNGTRPANVRASAKSTARRGAHGRRCRAGTPGRPVFLPPRIDVTFTRGSSSATTPSGSRHGWLAGGVAVVAAAVVVGMGCSSSIMVGLVSPSKSAVCPCPGPLPRVLSSSSSSSPLSLSLSLPPSLPPSLSLSLPLSLRLSPFLDWRRVSNGNGTHATKPSTRTS